VGATSQLDTAGEDVVQIVKVMTGLIRDWFASRPDLLVEWESASNVMSLHKSDAATPSPGTTAGEVKPAA
jgi:hypothetical protein